MAKHRFSCASITSTRGLMCPSPTNTGSGFCKSANASEPREPETPAAVRTICPPNAAPVRNVRIAIKRSKANRPLPLTEWRNVTLFPWHSAKSNIGTTKGLFTRSTSRPNSLFEAVAAAVHVFRKSDWGGHPLPAGLRVQASNRYRKHRRKRTL